MGELRHVLCRPRSRHPRCPRRQLPRQSIHAPRGGGQDGFAARLSGQTNDALGNEQNLQIIVLDDTYNIAIGETRQTTVLDGVLVNDYVVGTGTLSIVTAPQHGSVTLNSDGTFSYTQTTYGYDFFVYQLMDGFGKSAQATVELLVEGLPRLPENAILTMTGSGLEFYDFSVGVGDSPLETDSVNVDYVGYLPNGSIFDSNNGITFSLQNLIQGFTEGVVGMNVGGMRRIIIPPDLGYGPNGNPGAGIGGEDTIIFDVTLNSIQ